MHALVQDFHATAVGISSNRAGGKVVLGIWWLEFVSESCIMASSPTFSPGQHLLSLFSRVMSVSVIPDTLKFRGQTCMLLCDKI